MAIRTQTDRSAFEQRFGFSEKGTFYCGFAGEYLLFALMIGVMVAGVLEINAFIIKPAMEQTEAAMFLGIASALVNAVWVALCLILANMLMSGFKCSYELDEDKMTTQVLLKRRTIFYSEVTNVAFDEMTFMNRTHGYIVTVTTLNGTYRYRLVFSNRYAASSEKGTPFYALVERSERLRRKSETPPAAQSFYDAAQAEPSDYTDIAGAQHMNSFQQQAVGSLISEVEREAPAEEKPRKPEVEPLSPTEGSYDIPELGGMNSFQRTALSDLLYDGAENTPPAAPFDPTEYRMGEETERNALVGKGKMSLERKWDIPAAFGVVIAAMAIASAVITCAEIGDEIDFLIVVALLLTLDLLPALIALVTLLDGNRLEYMANGEEFRITDRKGKLYDTFYYKDIESIDYRPLMLMWFQRGFIVRIKTKYRTVTYKWVFRNKMKTLSFRKTPFQIMLERMPGGEKPDAWDA